MHSLENDHLLLDRAVPKSAEGHRERVAGNTSDYRAAPRAGQTTSEGAIFQNMENFGGSLRFLRSFFGTRTSKWSSRAVRVWQ